MKLSSLRSKYSSGVKPYFLTVNSRNSLPITENTFVDLLGKPLEIKLHLEQTSHKKKRLFFSYPSSQAPIPLLAKLMFTWVALGLPEANPFVPLFDSTQLYLAVLSCSSNNTQILCKDIILQVRLKQGTHKCLQGVYSSTLLSCVVA